MTFHFVKKIKIWFLLGLWVLSASSLSAASGPEIDLAVLDTMGDVGRHSSTAILNGEFVVSYHDASEGTCKFWLDQASGLGEVGDGQAQAYEIQTIPTQGQAGLYTSVVVVNGRLAICYYNSTYGRLELWLDDGHGTDGVADNQIPEPSEVRVIDDSAAKVGSFTSMIVAPQGYLALSYLDATAENLKLWCDNSQLGARNGLVEKGEIKVIDFAGGRHSSLALTSDGDLAVSYQAQDQLKLWVDENANSNFDEGEIRTIDDNTKVTATSLTTLGESLAIAYALNGVLQLWVDDFEDPDFQPQSKEFRMIASGIRDPSLAVLNGFLSIVYYDAAQDQLKCWFDGGIPGSPLAGNRKAEIEEIFTLDQSSENVGRFPALIEHNETGVCSYLDVANEDLRFAQIDFLLPQTLDGNEFSEVGLYSSSVNYQGRLVVAYHDATAGDLKLFHDFNGDKKFQKSEITIIEDAQTQAGQYAACHLTTTGRLAVAYLSQNEETLVNSIKVWIDEDGNGRSTNESGQIQKNEFVTIETDVMVDTQFSLTQVGGHLALLYHTAQNGTLKCWWDRGGIAGIGADNHQVDTGEILNLLTSLDEVSQISLAEFNGRLAASYMKKSKEKTYEVWVSVDQDGNGSFQSEENQLVAATAESSGDTALVTDSGRLALAYYSHEDSQFHVNVWVDHSQDGMVQSFEKRSLELLTSTAPVFNSLTVHQGQLAVSFLSPEEGLKLWFDGNGDFSSQSEEIHFLDQTGGSHNALVSLGDRLLVSYHDEEASDLKLAQLVLSGVPPTVIDSGRDSALTTFKGRLAIAYYDPLHDDLKFWADANGNRVSDPGEVRLLDGLGDVGRDPSAVHTLADQLAVSYEDRTKNDLKLWLDGNGDGHAQIEEFRVIDDEGGEDVSIGLTSTGFLATAYAVNDVLKIWVDANGDTQASKFEIHDTGIRVSDTALAVTPEGHLAVSYVNEDNKEISLWIDGNDDFEIGPFETIRVASFLNFDRAQVSLAADTVVSVAFHVEEEEGQDGFLKIWRDENGDHQVSAEEIIEVTSAGGSRPSLTSLKQGQVLAVSYRVQGDNSGLALWIDDGLGGGIPGDRLINGNEVRLLDAENGAGHTNELMEFRKELFVSYSSAEHLKLTWISPENAPPVAQAGMDQIVFLEKGTSTLSVMLNSQDSMDPENQPLDFAWRDESGVVFSKEALPVVELSEGVHAFELTVTDQGAPALSSSDQVVITVEKDLTLMDRFLNAQFGFSLASGWDFDQDGTLDLLVGGPGHEDKGKFGLISGSESQSGIATVLGRNVGDAVGHSVAVLKPSSQESEPFVVIGAPYFDSDEQENTGQVYVTTFEKSQFVLSQALKGENPQDLFGFSVKEAGDVNNDGWNDLLIGAPGYRVNNQVVGKVYVYSGNFTQDPELLYSFVGDATYGDHLGEALAGGLADGDSFSDIILGSPRSRLETDSLKADRGRVLVYSGQTGELIWEKWGEAEKFLFGTSVSSARDVNGDGQNEVLIGAPATGTVADPVGAVYLCDSLTGDTLWSVSGQKKKHLFGSRVSFVGDTNQDGYEDFAVSSLGYFNDQGRVQFFGGRSCEEETCDFEVLLTLVGEAEGDQFGFSLAQLGQTELGNSIVAIGAPYFDDPEDPQNTDVGSVIYVLDRVPLYDTEPPLITFTGSLPEYANGPFSVTYSFENDGGSDQVGIDVDLSSGEFEHDPELKRITLFPGPLNGVHTLTLTATDSEGNASSDFYSFNFDTQAPETIVSNPDAPGALFSGSILVSWITFDSLSAANQVDLSLRHHETGNMISLTTQLSDNGQYIFDSSLVDDGFYVAVVQPTDAAGNQGDPAFSKVFEIDNIQPELRVTSPLLGDFLSGQHLVTWTTTHQTGHFDILLVDPTGQETLIAKKISVKDLEFDWDTALQDSNQNPLYFDGNNYQVKIEKEDGVAALSENFSLDNTHPVLHSLEPSGVFSNSNLPALSWITEDNNPDTVDIFQSIDGGTFFTPVAKNIPDTGSYLLGTLPEGNYIFRVQAADAAGNLSESVSIQDVIVDDTAPLVKLTSPQSNDVVSGQTVISWDVEDDNPSVSEVRLYRQGVLIDVLKTAFAKGKFTWDTFSYHGEGFEVGVIATDQAGHVSQEAFSGVFTIDNAPKVSGSARYFDSNFNGQIDTGDQLIVGFDQEVDYTIGSDPSKSFELKGSGNFGSTAQLVERAGHGLHEVVIELGAGAHLKARQDFDTQKSEANAPTGVDVSANPNILSLVHGVGATPSHPLDVIAGFVKLPGGIGGTGFRNDLVLEDIDQDGSVDAAMIVEGRPRIYLNKEGTWNPIFFPSEADQGRALVLGDWNRDGDLDVALARDGANQIWLSQGGSSFVLDQELGNQTTEAIVSGDLDCDGDLDLITGNSDGADRLWLYDHKKGRFELSFFNFGLGPTRALAMGDLNQDGYLDLVSAVSGDEEDKNIVFLNSGNGILMVPKFDDDQKRLSPGTATTSVVLGDVDRDGDLDIIFGNGNPDVPSEGASDEVWLNDGDGNFNLGQELGSYNTSDLALEDYDQDGDLDLLASHSAGVEVWLNDGMGEFQESGLKPSSSVSTFALGDLDQNGDLDLVIGRPTSSSQAEIYNNSLSAAWGTASLNQMSVDLNIAGSATDTLLGDLDRDGDLDLIVHQSHQVEEAIRVFENNGQGDFSLDLGDGIGANTGLGGPNFRAMALGDVNKDGYLDLVIANGNFVPNEIWLGEGDGSFTNSNLNLSDKNTMDVVLGDVNQDGFLDLIFANENAANEIWLGAEGLSFSLTQTFGEVTGASRSLALKDLDRDGDLDLVVGNAGSQANQIYINDGSGHFSDSGQALGSADSVDLALGDVDGDGDCDLVVANTTGLNKLYLNEAGTFTESSEDLGSGFTTSLCLIDFDGDGDLDLIFGKMKVGSSSSVNQVYRNDGTGHFTTHLKDDFASHNTLDLTCGDVDQDGDLDVVAGNEKSQSRLWKNQ